MKEILCRTCNIWVDCGKKDGKPHGFCLARDLFTYTEETECMDYSKGQPSTEAEYEEAQDQWLTTLKKQHGNTE